MKKLAVVVLSLVVLGLTTGAAENPKAVHIAVSGLHCDNCVEKVEKALKGIKGVEKVGVNLEKGEAVVTLASNAKVKTETLVNAVAKAGYEAKAGKIHATPTEKCEDACKDKKDQASKDAGCCSTDKKAESGKTHGKH